MTKGGLLGGVFASVDVCVSGEGVSERGASLISLYIAFLREKRRNANNEGKCVV